MLSFFNKNLESLCKLICSPLLIFSFLFIFGSTSHAQTVQVVVIKGTYFLQSAFGAGGAPGGGGDGGCYKNCYTNEAIPTEAAYFDDDIYTAARNTDVRCQFTGSSAAVTSKSSYQARLGVATALAQNPRITGPTTGYATKNGVTTFRAVYADGGSETWFVKDGIRGSGAQLTGAIESSSPGDGVVRQNPDCPNLTL